jgi:methylated-DNA-[protein]-cysteine S-methyltransferase
MNATAAFLPTPLGDMLAVIDDAGVLVRLDFTGENGKDHCLARIEKTVLWDREQLKPVETQISEYFRRERTVFDLPVETDGTPFQQLVWKELQEIPFGRTCSYGDLANRIGRPSAVRAVGHANGQNPISLIIPCHRVIGANGSLTGYGGGLSIKRQLLDFESGQM